MQLSFRLDKRPGETFDGKKLLFLVSDCFLIYLGEPMCFILLECLQFAHLLLSIFGPSLRAKSAATEENKFNVNQYLLHSVLLEL